MEIKDIGTIFLDVTKNQQGFINLITSFHNRLT
jgi:hypothetical protein